MFKAALLAWLLAHGAPGRSVYSFEALDACGSNPLTPACAVERVCEAPGPLCAPPRWNAFRGAWVRVESKEAATARWTGIVEVLVGTASRLITCRLPDGSVDFDCTPVRWSGGKGQVRDLAMTAAVVALHESGYREDVQIGAPPAGRGPDREACLMQIMPDQIAPLATWLSPDERKAAGVSKEATEALAQRLLGRSPEALGRCFEVGMRALARAKAQCVGKRLGDAGTFAAYGTGGRCGSASEQWALDRTRSLASLRASVQTAK